MNRVGAERWGVEQRVMLMLGVCLGMGLAILVMTHYSRNQTLPRYLWVILGIGVFSALGRLPLPGKLQRLLALALGVGFFGLTLGYVAVRFTP